MTGRRGLSCCPKCGAEIAFRPIATVSRLARMMGVSRRTVYAWIAKGYVESAGYTPRGRGIQRVFLDTVRCLKIVDRD